MKFLVIGDACRDIYHYGTLLRKNPEASAPLLSFNRTITKDGMAMNVAENLRALGATVDTLVPPTPWSEKRRYIDERSGAQLLRMDRDVIHPPGTITSVDLKMYDGIVVSDYDKGFVSHDLVMRLSRFSENVFIDTKKKNLGQAGRAWFKLNEHETAALESRPENLITTAGSRGCYYGSLYVPARPIEVVDVCGAGDTFLAAFAYAKIKTGGVKKSLKFANHCAGLTCQHRGAHAPRVNL